MMDAAMGKEVDDVALRLWTPKGAEVAFVRQVAPAIEDLTTRATPSGPLSADYPTGAWGDESPGLPRLDRRGGASRRRGDGWRAASASSSTARWSARR